MPETIPVQCGACLKRFRIREDQVNRVVRCPHCKTVARIGAEEEAPLAPARPPVPISPALAEIVAAERAEPEMARKKPVVVTGLKSKNAAIIWAAVLGGLVVVAIVAVAILASRGPPQQPAKVKPPVAAAVPSPPRATVRPGAPAGEADTVGQAEEGSAGTRVGAASSQPAGGRTAQGETAAGEQTEGGTTQDAVIFQNVKVIGGGEYASYVAGRLTNTTGATIKVLKVVVPINGSDGKKIGDAAVVLLNVPSGATIPLVAVWPHDPDVRGVAGKPTYKLEPPGIAEGLPSIEVDKDSVVPWPDPNTMTFTGFVKMVATNRSRLAVPGSPGTDMFALLVDKDGKIVGAAKGTWSKDLAPGKAEEISVRWTNCVGRLVDRAEAWAQPHIPGM